MYHFSNIYKKNKIYKFHYEELNINSDDLNSFNKNFIELKTRFQKKKNIQKIKIKEIIINCNLLHKKIYNDLVKQTKDKKLIKFLKSIEFFSNKNLDETLNFFLKSKYYSDLSNNNYLNLKKKSYYKISFQKNFRLILVNSNKYFPKLFNNVKKGKINDQI